MKFFEIFAGIPTMQGFEELYRILHNCIVTDWNSGERLSPIYDLVIYSMKGIVRYKTS